MILVISGKSWKLCLISVSCMCCARALACQHRKVMEHTASRRYSPSSACSMPYLSRNCQRGMIMLELSVLESRAHRKSSKPLWCCYPWRECPQASARQSLSLRMSACPLTPLVCAAKSSWRNIGAFFLLWTKSTHLSVRLCSFLTHIDVNLSNITVADF